MSAGARAWVLPAVCLFVSVRLSQANLVVNGSFESGNSDFSSDYQYLPTPSATAMDAGQYGVIQSLDQAHSAWAAFGSLSAQSGSNYFVANGSSNATESPWMQTITVNPGDIDTSTAGAPIYYRFQAYIASVYPFAAQPQLAFEMSLNNSGAWQELTTSTVPGAAYNWYLTYRDGYFGIAPTTISFRLRNTVTAGNGNDFAADSIFFGLSTSAPAYNPVNTPINSVGEITGGAFVPEPGTSAVAAMLVSGVAFVRWRRRGTAE